MGEREGGKAAALNQLMPVRSGSPLRSREALELGVGCRRRLWALGRVERVWGLLCNCPPGPGSTPAAASLPLRAVSKAFVLPPARPCWVSAHYARAPAEGREGRERRPSPAVSWPKAPSLARTPARSS